MQIISSNDSHVKLNHSFLVQSELRNLLETKKGKNNHETIGSLCSLLEEPYEDYT